MAFTAITNAQTTTLHGDYTNFIPKSFTIDEKAKLVCGDEIYDIYDNEEVNASIYNENFEKESTVTIKQEKYILHKYEQRWPIGVLEYLEPWGEIFDKEEGIDSSFVHEGITYHVFEWEDDPDTDGKRPSLVYSDEVDNGQMLYRCQYTERFSGDWFTTSDGRESTNYPINLSYKNLDASSIVTETEGLYLTQTLLNDDEKYEYLIPDITSMTEKLSSEQDRDGDGVIDYRTFTYVPTSLNIINSDGEQVGTLKFTTFMDDDYIHVIRWGGKLYFYCESDTLIDDKWEYTQHFYLFERNTTSLKKIETPAMFRIAPQITKRYEAVEVEIAEEASRNGGKLVVTDMNGRTVHTQTVPVGESTLKLHVHNLATGVYGVSYITNGKRIDSSKLIVR